MVLPEAYATRRTSKESNEAAREVALREWMIYHGGDPGDLKGAEMMYRSLLATDSSNTAARLGLATVHFWQGHSALARSESRAACAAKLTVTGCASDRDDHKGVVMVWLLHEG